MKKDAGRDCCVSTTKTRTRNWLKKKKNCYVLLRDIATRQYGQLRGLVQKPTGCDDLNRMKRVKCKQVAVTGDDDFRLSIDGEFQELVILWVTASIDFSDNGHFLDNPT